MAPSPIDAYLDRAAELSQRQRFAEAAQLYQTVLQTDDLNLDALEGLALCFFNLEDYPQAIEQFTALAQMRPTEGKSYFNIGAIYNRLGEYQLAVDAIRKGLSRDKRCAEGYYNLGISHRKLGQHQLAISAYREALKVNPKFAEAYQNMGNIYLELANYQSALQNFQKALELRPDFERAQAGIKKTHAAMEAAARAESPFGRLVDPNEMRTVMSFDRELTESEQLHDRRQIFTLARHIEQVALQWRDVLRESLEPALLEVQRAVSSGDRSRVTLKQATQELMGAMQHASEIRRAMRRKALELRAHEELMFTPQFEIPAPE